MDLLVGAAASAALALLAAAAGAAPQAASDSAQATPAGASPTALDPVTVEARRRELINRQVSEFVYAAVGSGKVESLARWKVPVCPVTVGLTPAEAEYVDKRVATIATDAKVALGKPGCGPNFVIIVTTEPEKLLKEWWSENHRLFNRERGLGAVERFIEMEQPVRVWHNACNAPPGIPATAFAPSEHCGVGVTGSRLTWNAIRAIYTAIVVVDLTKIEGLTFGQVADHVAMVGLAQIHRQNALGGVPTILALFDERVAEREKGLSDWDRSFLKAIYATTDGSVTGITQIKLRMSEDLAR